MKFDITGLQKHIDGKEILRDVSVSIREGAIFTIVGPSGSGKTMFLRTLNRLTEPVSGEILLDGVSIVTLDPRALRRRVGMVFQLPILFPGTVSENILTGPRLWSGKEKSAPEESDRLKEGRPIEIMNLLKSIGLPEEYADRDARKLSVGEQQRVCIARALANNPEVLLMDEPTASLDPTTTLKIESLITSLNKELRLTVVVVTHNMEQARRIGDTTMYLENGRVRDIQPTSTFFTENPCQELKTTKASKGKSIYQNPEAHDIVSSAECGTGLKADYGTGQTKKPDYDTVGDDG